MDSERFTDSTLLVHEWAVLAIVLILITPIILKYASAAASISVIGAAVGILEGAGMKFAMGKPFMG